MFKLTTPSEMQSEIEKHDLQTGQKCLMAIVLFL